MNFNWLIVAVMTLVAITGDAIELNRGDFSYIETDGMTNDADVQSFGNTDNVISAANSDEILLSNKRILWGSHLPFCQHGSTEYMCNNCKGVYNTYLLYNNYVLPKFNIPCRSFHPCVVAENACEQCFHNTVNTPITNWSPAIRMKPLHPAQTFGINPILRYPNINFIPNYIHTDFLKPEYLSQRSVTGINRILPFGYVNTPSVVIPNYPVCNNGAVNRLCIIPDLTDSVSCPNANYAFCSTYHTQQYPLLYPKPYNVALGSGITFGQGFESALKIHTIRTNPEMKFSSVDTSGADRGNGLQSLSNRILNINNAVDIDSDHGAEMGNDVTTGEFTDEDNDKDYEETDDGITQNEIYDETVDNDNNFRTVKEKLTRRNNNDIFKNAHGTEYNTRKRIMVKSVQNEKPRQRKVRISIKVNQKKNRNKRR